MNKLEFLILSILMSNNAVLKIRGMTVEEIIAAEELDCKVNTFYKQLKTYCDHGTVGIGAKDGRKVTFYITKTGIQKLKEEKEDEK
jgi:hypothetical protein